MASNRVLRSYNLDPEQAEFLSALSILMNKSKSQLVRESVDLLIRQSMEDGNLQDRLKEYLQNMEQLEDYLGTLRQE